MRWVESSMRLLRRPSGSRGPDLGLAASRAALSALLLTGALACRKSPPPPIRIGLVTYVDGALNGPPTTRAVEMAVSRVNAAGGILLGGKRRQVEVLRVAIAEGSPEPAVAAVQRFINQEKVCAIIGPPISDEAIPAGGLANRSGVPMISPLSTHSLTTKDRPFVFRVCFRDEFQGKAIAQFARHTLKARTAALMVNINIAYSRTIAEMFRQEFVRLGGRIVADESFLRGQEDLAAPMRRIRQASADVLLIPNYRTASQQAGVAARQAGIKSTLLGTDSWHRRELLPLPEFEGAYMVTNWSPDLDTPANGPFIADYRQRYSEDPTETAALTYDAATMLLQAIAASSDGSPSAIQKALYAPAGFQGTSGPIRYTSSGDPEKAAVILQFKAGKAVVASLVRPTELQ